MKKLISVSLTATLFGILFFSSCSKEDPATPNDPNGTEPRARFHGHWLVNENSQDFGASTYYSDITDSTNASYILLSGLYGFNVKTHATVSGNNFTITTPQIIQGNYISGNGTLTNSNLINLKYIIQSTATHYDTITATLTK